MPDTPTEPGWYWWRPAYGGGWRPVRSDEPRPADGEWGPRIPEPDDDRSE